MNLVLKRMKQFMFMSITKGDIISVSFVVLTIPRIGSKLDSNRVLDEPWWFGEIHRQGRGVRGLFPSNYITVTDQVRQRYRIRTPTGMVQNENFTKLISFQK